MDSRVIEQLADMIAQRVIITMNAADRPVEPAYLDRGQVAQYLGVSTVTVDRMIRDGRLPVIRIGRRVKFARDAVLAAMRGQL